MKNKNPLWLALSVAIIIVALSVGYYLVIYIPKKDALEQQIIEKEKQEQAENQRQKDLDYHSCLITASASYTSWWDDSCKSKGLKEDCRLPSSEADTINASHEKEKDRCLQIYKSQ